MTPYFYKIKETTTGRYYVGVQYGATSDPTNLWVTYFTSSKYIKNQPKENFKVVKIIIREDAREYERRYLRKCFSIMGRDVFMTLMINRNIAPGILNTYESIQKANQKKKISNKIAAHRLIEQGKHNFQTKRHIPTEQQKKASSVRMMGNVYGSLRIITNEYRELAAQKSMGNENVKGKKWWNDGKQRKRSKQQPGPEWTEGYKTKGF